MKELTIEEKAKAYDKALERAKTMIDDLRKGEDILSVPNLEAMFPELKENEDEGIKKTLINLFKVKGINKVGDFTNKEIIAWLEKQGEQTSTNNQFTLEQAGVLDKHIDKFIKQKPAEWSEEDYNKISSIKYLLHELDNHNFDDWLDSLKCKPQYNNSSWSEEDEKKFRDVIRLVEQVAPVQSIRDYYTNWLKSLKDRVQTSVTVEAE